MIICGHTFEIAELSLMISIVSLLISVFVFVRNCWVERFKIKCSLVKWFASQVSNQPFYLWLNITNQSKLPCSITKIELEFIRHGNLITAVSQGNGKLISTSHSNNKDVEHFSLDLPFAIDGYKSIGGYIHFISDSPHFYFEEQRVKINIITNRGVYRTKLHLRYGDNIFRVWQQQSDKNPVKYVEGGEEIKFSKEGF